jgi:hypothetical protein
LCHAEKARPLLGRQSAALGFSRERLKLLYRGAGAWPKIAIRFALEMTERAQRALHFSFFLRRPPRLALGLALSNWRSRRNEGLGLYRWWGLRWINKRDPWRGSNRPRVGHCCFLIATRYRCLGFG